MICIPSINDLLPCICHSEMVYLNNTAPKETSYPSTLFYCHPKTLLLCLYPQAYVPPFCPSLSTHLHQHARSVPGGFVMPRFWSHGIKIVHDAYIVFKSWRGAQGQGPAIDLVFYLSMIKVDVNGSHVGQAWYILRYHVNMQFNKIPQIDMHYNEIDGGTISQGIGMGIIQTLEPIGWD